MTPFQQALAAVPELFQEEVSRHWQALGESAQRDQVTLPDRPEDLSQLVRAWTASEFVARTCSREPRLLAELLDSGDLSQSYGEDGHRRRLEARLEGVQDGDDLGVRLRRFRRREMVRIAWRDLNDLAPLTEILADLSRLAETCIDSALAKLHDWEAQRHGQPRSREGELQQLVVLGMGKLGGMELNYSSDIDLIFAFPERGETDGRRSVDNEEFFRRLGQKLIKALNEQTAEGFVFRVDMRLRPFGESGPLAASFTALETYYQNQGRAWERYAMIKARVVAGDREAGQRLLDTLRPFVFRRYLDYSAFESLREMKTLIVREVERKGLQHNVKLGPGGIREIEFIGQAFQLIYGGREPVLRERSILTVLDYLAETQRLPEAAVEELKAAYEFLRRTENRLQEWADHQTHVLPDDQRARQRLAYTMGFADWQAFRKALSDHVRQVENQFQQVFIAPQTQVDEPSEEVNFSTIWEGAPEAAGEFLTRQGYDDPQAALDSLGRLRTSFSFRALSARGRGRLDQLIPLVLGAVVRADHPARTLDRITRLIEAIARRSVYLALLVENPMALSQLVRLCDASIWIAEYLARYPLLLDELLDPASLYAPLDRQALDRELGRMLDRVPAEDTEQVMDVLRHFQHTNALRVAAAEVTGAMPLMVVSDHLTEIAEVLLRRVLTLAWHDMTARYGQPRCVIDGREHLPRLAIVAYGKLGGIELGYQSDLDLVFLHDSGGEKQETDGDRSLDNTTFFIRLGQRIIHFLSTQTPAGQLYEVDTRLRPSGKSGLLVTSLTAFADYQQRQAWTWEHQALVRTRVVAGPDDLRDRFNRVRREVLSRQRDATELRREVRQMRERMRKELGSSKAGYFHLKQDRGGIADIEFMVQYAVLANAHHHPELLTYTDNIRQIAGLELAGILTSSDAGVLRDAYRDLRRRAHRLKLQAQSSLVPREEVGEWPDAVARLWWQLLEKD